MFFLFLLALVYIQSQIHLKKYFLKKYPFHLLSILLLCVPILMGYQNWDDHDRSDRYTAQSLAKAYLNSIDKDKRCHDFYNWRQ